MKRSHFSCAYFIASVSALLVTSGQAEIVYDNCQTYQVQGTFYPPPSSLPTTEYGDQIVLSGTARTISEFQFEYFGEFNPTGQETVRVRFYANDGPGDPQFQYSHPPKTLLYESGPLPISGGFNAITLRGLAVTVTNTFTWTVQWGGLSGNVGNRAGLVFYDPPVAGSSFNDFWEYLSSSWITLYFGTSLIANFAARVEASPDPAIEIVSNTLLGNGQRELKVNGPTFQTAVLENSTNQTNWTELARFVFLGKPVVFVDTNAARAATNYYRARLAPAPYLTVQPALTATNGQFSLRLTGVPGRTVIVEGSGELIGWLPIFTNKFGNPPQIELTNPLGAGLNQRFYRVYYADEGPTALALDTKTWIDSHQTMLLVGGPSGRDFLLQTSTNLLQWTTLSTNTFSFTDGTCTLFAPPLTNSATRYYRTVLQP